MKPHAEKSYDAAELVKQFPPVVTNANKIIVYEISNSTPPAHDGEIEYSRWAVMALPANVPANAKTVFESKPDFFSYPVPAAGTVEWHLNFADTDLFAYYGGGLFAQDESQVAEHPALASLRLALLHDKLSVLTREGDQPTPILVRGVERRVFVATEPNASEFRPSGLYGNQFARADADVIRRATKRLDPPTVTSIVAVVAPSYGNGEYTAGQIRYILTTAYTGFRAAKLKSIVDGKPASKVIIHTGFWGCGAFGGNRILMVTLQMLAAKLAETDQVIFHTGDKAGLAQVKDAEQVLAECLRQTTDTTAIMTHLQERRFRWGTSDGN